MRNSIPRLSLAQPLLRIASPWLWITRPWLWINGALGLGFLLASGIAPSIPMPLLASTEVRLWWCGVPLAGLLVIRRVGGGPGTQGSNRFLWPLGLLLALSLTFGRLSTPGSIEDRGHHHPGTPIAEQPPLGRAQIPAVPGGTTLAKVRGHEIPVRLPTGWSRSGDIVRVPPGASLEYWGTRPGQTKQAHSWTGAPSELTRWRGRASPPGTWERTVDGVRLGIEKRLQSIEAEPGSGLPAALLLGHARGVDPACQDRFTRTGTRHLLALSGLHVGIFWWFWIAPIGALIARGLFPSHRRPIQAVVTLGLGLALVPILGNGTPAWRAMLAYGIATLARLAPAPPGAPPGVGRRVDGLNLWAFALVLESLHDPSAWKQVSLQLSYGATLALIACWPRWSRLYSVFETMAGPQPLDRPPWWTAVRHFLLRWIWEGIGASLIATLATLPLLWIHFGEWSPFGGLTTLLLLPAVALAVGLGGAFLLLPSAIPIALAQAPFRVMHRILEWADTLPHSPTVLPERPPELLMVGLGIAAFALWGPFPIRPLASRGGLALFAALVVPWRLPPEEMRIHVCDVGHGSALVCEMPCGRVLVFDGGSRDRRGIDRRVLIPLLRELDPGAIDIVVSHDDRDHAFALPRVASRFPVTQWIGPWPRNMTSDLRRGIDRVDLSKGTFAGSACRLRRCQWAVLRGADLAGNEGSRSLLLECDGSAVLLSGDAEFDGLAPLLKTLRAKAPLAALLIPHHGSEQPLWQALLAETDPIEIWCSGRDFSPIARAWEHARPKLRWTAREGAWTVSIGQMSQEDGKQAVNLVR